MHVLKLKKIVAVRSVLFEILNAFGFTAQQMPDVGTGN